MEITIDISVNRKAAASPPGTWVKVKIAEGSVCVSPGMLETKVIVTPNSPMLRAKHKIILAMPGTLSGSVITRNTLTGPAPRVFAASSN